MNARPNYDGPEMEFARAVKAAVAGAFVVGILLIVAGTQGGAGVVNDAIAAQQPADPDPYTYFPSHFPTPEGTSEAHIEAF